jgi:amino acid permease
MSALIGGGICGMSYNIYYVGNYWTMAFFFISATQTINRTWLYLEAKDMVPGKPESFFEIGYILLGRKSIFMICVIIVFNSIIGTTPVLILAAKTFSQFFENILMASGSNPESKFYKIMIR